GDKGFIRPILKQELTEHGTYLETPLRDNMSDERPKSFIKWLTSTRRLIETVGELCNKAFRIRQSPILECECV
ncbi:MAG: transposase, partial [Waddliaceae bacterium]